MVNPNFNIDLLYLSLVVSPRGRGGGEGGYFHIKVSGILRGINCRFWSHLGCLGRKVTILPIQASLRLCIKKFTKNYRDTDHIEIVFQEDSSFNKSIKEIM